MPKADGCPGGRAVLRPDRFIHAPGPDTRAVKRRGAAAGFDEASDRRGTVNTGATAPDGLFIREISVKAGADGGYAMELPAVQRLGKLVLTAPVTFFVGENGSGKSTVLEAIAIACGFNPEGGTRNFCFKTSDSHASLWQALHIVRGARRPGDGFFLRAESFYNVATKIDELDRETPFGPRLIDSYGGRSMHAQSHGESFLSLVVNRFGGQGFICSTSRRPPCPLQGSLPCSRGCAYWCKTARSLSLHRTRRF